MPRILGVLSELCVRVGFFTRVMRTGGTVSGSGIIDP